MMVRPEKKILLATPLPGLSAPLSAFPNAHSNSKPFGFGWSRQDCLFSGLTSYS
jgi:hypothetical protein